MNSGNSMTLLNFVDTHGLLFAVTAGVILGTNPNAASKQLASLTAAGEVERVPYIGRRFLWKRYGKLGCQALKTRAALVCFCAHGETRWKFHYWDGPAAICTSGEMKEAVFLDLGG